MKIFEKFKNDWTTKSKFIGILNFDSIQEFVSHINSLKAENEFGKA